MDNEIVKRLMWTGLVAAHRRARQRRRDACLGCDLGQIFKEDPPE